MSYLCQAKFEEFKQSYFDEQSEKKENIAPNSDD